MQIKPIEWADPLPCDSDVRYDHVYGECPLGRFLITWKSWKDYPGYCIDETPWNEWGGVADTLDEAKQMAWDKYSELVGACIEGYNA